MYYVYHAAQGRKGQWEVAKVHQAGEPASTAMTPTGTTSTERAAVTCKMTAQPWSPPLGLQKAQGLNRDQRPCAAALVPPSVIFCLCLYRCSGKNPVEALQDAEVQNTTVPSAGQELGSWCLLGDQRKEGGAGTWQDNLPASRKAVKLPSSWYYIESICPLKTMHKYFCLLYS